MKYASQNRAATGSTLPLYKLQDIVVDIFCLGLRLTIRRPPTNNAYPGSNRTHAPKELTSGTFHQWGLRRAYTVPGRFVQNIPSSRLWIHKDAEIHSRSRIVLCSVGCIVALEPLHHSAWLLRAQTSIRPSLTLIAPSPSWRGRDSQGVHLEGTYL